MPEFILLMHDDATDGENGWEVYLGTLRRKGCFEGGSAIGDGVCLRKQAPPGPMTAHLSGYIRLTADSLEQAKSLLDGNPHYEAGGTVEIRELPRTG